jgi:Domain of unknown function (DUF6456)
MSGDVERALARLVGAQAILAPAPGGAGFGVFANGDRRRRPSARLSAAQVRDLSASGALAALPEKNVFVLSPAGRARVRRAEAAPSEAYAAQHRPVEDRAVIDVDGDVQRVRGHDPHGPLRRLAALRGANGAPWLAPQELAAALRLRGDWEVSQIGLVRGSDWSAGPQSGSARGPGGREAALAARCDAGRRAAAKLEALAPALRRVVERV